MFNALSPNLLVEDVEKSLEFYQILGFEKIARIPENGKAQWAMLKGGEVSIMLQEKKSAQFDLPFRFTQGQNAGAFLYIDVENLEELRSQIDGKAIVLKDIFSTFYGTHEFIISDPDHFVLIFAQDVK
jgi:predicted lactoylglutathione lyase